jgi:hypothetical protein
MHRPIRPSRAVAAAALALAVVAAACSSSSNDRVTPVKATTPAHVHDHASAAATAKRAAFHDDMRKLWEDHITWTRLYIVSAEAGLPDTDATLQRLLQNQTDIGNAIKPFYGDAAGAQLTSLLRDHILIAGDLVAAAKANDTAKVATTKDKWYANADQIGDFLGQANPMQWPAAEMRQMMHEHLDNTLAEAVDHLKGDSAADIADYDKVHVQILDMADMLSSGIVAQFPQQFA